MFFRDDKTGWDAAAISIALMLMFAPIALTFHMAHRGHDPAGPDPRHTRGNDMIQFWVGAAVLESGSAGADLYDADVFARAFDAIESVSASRGYGPTYPPPIYQAFAAIDGLGQIFATKLVLWFYLLVCAIGVAVLLLAAGYDLRRGIEAWLLLCCAPAALLGISTGQSAAIWLAFLAGGFWLWRRERDLLAGVAFSFLCIKPTLAAPVLFTLVLMSQWRVIAGFALGGAAILVLSISLDGTEVWRGYLEMLLRNPDLTQQLWSSLHRHFSFRSLVSVPLAESAWAAPVGFAGAIAAIAIAIWFRVKLAPTFASEARSFSAFAILLGASAFATPHLLDYDLVLYFPLLIFGGYRIAEGRAANPRVGLAAVSAFYLAPLVYPISDRIHFSIGSLLVLMLLAWCASEIAAPGDAVSETRCA